MREDKLNFGIFLRTFISLLPILFGMPLLATIFCAYNIAMTFIAVGPMSALVTSLSSVMISMLLSSSFGASAELEGLVIGLQAVLCAAGCIYGLFKKKDFYNGLFLSTIGILVPQLIYTKSLANKSGLSVADMMVPSTEELVPMINQFITLPKGFENPFGTIEAIAQLTREFTVIVIPSSFIVTSMVLAYIVVWAVAAPLRKSADKKKIHSFSRIKLHWSVTILIIAFLVLVLGGVVKATSPVGTVIVNMLIVLSSMAFFAGVSLLDFALRKVIPIRFVRIIIHVFVSLNFFIIYILAALVDSFADFRKLRKYKNENGGEDYETEKREN